MRKIIFTAGLLLLTLSACYAQFSVAYHQSSLPFVAVGYEIKDRLMPELRIGTNLYLTSDFSPELVLNYQFVNKQDYEFYAGLGFRVNTIPGLVLPLGLNIFPFDQRKFGFHIETTPMLEFEGDFILRGSWGIRYRFTAE